jgi:branched-chain amino acid transport system ATP-binding protein
MTTGDTIPTGLALEAQGLTRRFGGFVAVDGVSLTVEPGALVGVIGPNGAGKSTLFGMLTGFLEPDAGTVRLDGADITRVQSYRRARLGIARTFQVPREFGSLSVRANLMAAAPAQSGESLLRLFTQTGRIKREESMNTEKTEETAAFLRLTSVLDLPAANLSGGQKKLLEIGRALMTNPRLMLLDEPFAGVNPVLIEEIMQRIRDLHARGMGFLIIEHDLAALTRLVGTLHMMDQGRLIASGPPAQVLARADVREAYLGGDVGSAEHAA